MLLFDMMVQVTVGTTFALRDREQRAATGDKPLESRAFRDGLLYGMLIYVPSAIFFLYAWPGWNSMYLLDIETRRIVGGFYAFIDTAALFGCYILGFFLVSRWTRAGTSPKGVLLRIGAAWGAILVLLFVVLWGRSFAVTSYHDFVSRDWPRFEVRWGAEDSMFGRPIMWWLIVWAALDFVPLGIIYAVGRKRAKAAPS